MCEKNKLLKRQMRNEVKSKPEMWFFWSVVVRVPVLVAKGPYLFAMFGYLYIIGILK